MVEFLSIINKEKTALPLERLSFQLVIVK